MHLSHCYLFLDPHMSPFVDGQGKDRIFNSQAVNIDYLPKILKVINPNPSIGGHKTKYS